MEGIGVSTVGNGVDAMTGADVGFAEVATVGGGVGPTTGAMVGSSEGRCVGGSVTSPPPIVETSIVLKGAVSISFAVSSWASKTSMIPAIKTA